ncbi:MAG: glycolate oxidase subunit GlcF [Rhodocyclales bacterium]|nr:glycolate oxidase subunit GlcF [Rhodocyclales bacterium]
MQTQLADFIKNQPEGREADEILRKCVHCGFCTATCPTYQLLGDELDGPRGRIYLIKAVLEGQPATVKTRQHLDRCLTCRSCESTCPSGVHYSRLLDIGRAVVEQQVPRQGLDKAVRWALREFVPRAGLFGMAMRAGRLVRGALPQALKDKVPLQRPAGAWPSPRHARKMLALAGCAQPAMAPSINVATARVLDALGVSLIEAPGAGCCGAVRFHLNDQDGGRDDARRNIDAWWPLVERGEVEAIVMTASGCGVQVKDYAHMLAHDPAYANKAERISVLTRDVSEIVTAESARLIEVLASPPGEPVRVAFHAPCTLQHGLKIRGVVEKLLVAAGYVPTPVRDAHLCCGSAGTYSILQPELSLQLRDNKLAALGEGRPAIIASANIGCMTHLEAGATTPVRHWIELLAERLGK